MESKSRSGWFWIPSLYYAEGIPYFVVMFVSVIMYKRMGVSNTDIALYTSWLYLPWTLKPLWSPVVDLVRTKRFWITFTQLVMAVGLCGVAFSIPMTAFFTITLGFLWLLAFSSSTHDIAADGFYMLGLSKHDQAGYVGVRSTFYRLAGITCQGLLIMLAGYIESSSGLDDANITILAGPDLSAASGREVNPSVLDTGEKLNILLKPLELQIATIPRSGARMDSIIKSTREWNLTHGHTRPEEANGQESKADSGLSWWRRAVSLPLGDFLRRNFGKKQATAARDEVGNVGIASLYLSRAPETGQQIVVNFGRTSGDKSISLVEGSRLLFDENNWNIPAKVAIQLDPKLRKVSSAKFKASSGNIPLAWSLTFFLLAGLFVSFSIYHRFLLPFPDTDHPAIGNDAKNFLREFFKTFGTFFKKKRIGVAIAFILLYRFGEAQLGKLAAPFLLDAQEIGGLALTTGQVGFVYGTVGLLMLTLGGLLGGFVAARNGLKFWLWPMVVAINLPNVVYVYMAYAQPDSFLVITFCVGIEQFGYGFGFTSFMLYMIYIAEGTHKTSHFAICTSFMAIGMMIPGMFSGWIQEMVGYQNFFVWVLLATLPGFFLLPFLGVDKEFGKKTQKA